MDSFPRHRRRLYRRAVAALLLMLPLSACQSSESERIDAFVRAEMERQKIPGLALAIVKAGEVVEARGYGMANVEHRVPVQSNTIFQSGSVGKMFTAVVVMLLVEDGKLALDDSIARYIAEAPARWKPVTIRHLLTHTSGIPDYGESLFDNRRDYSHEEFVEIAAGLELEFAPGTRWNYSNTGYALLGVIVRRVSGKFYYDILEERVFGPLGMETARVISEADIIPNRAAGYRLVDGELRNQEWVSPQNNTGADGSLYFSVLDLIAWDRGLRAGAVLSPASWAQVFESVELSSGKHYPYGFGWTVLEFAGQELHRHGGSWQGFRADLARYLGDELTIAVLANLAEAEPGQISDGIAGILNPALARPELAPIPDREPQVTARFEGLIAAARAGRLAPAQFAYVRAGFFPGVAEEYVELLSGLGEPERIDLLERSELGDDRIYEYRMTYADAKLRATLGLAPDDQISVLHIWRE